MTDAKDGIFSQAEADTVERVIRSRRDVRGNRFVSDPVPDSMLEKIFEAAMWAPSVGYSQPWRFITVHNQDTKRKVAESFATENQKASALFTDDKQALYQQLKLEGIKEAPVNLAVYYCPSEQPVLGQTSMPDMGRFSVVCAIENMWLMARALNIGVGWVSILDPTKVSEALQAPDHWELIGYLCLGYTNGFLSEPELEKLGWDKRRQRHQVWFEENAGNKKPPE
ncbi:5,6-dimethylbenzimidazole synthase [Corallincola platygyrae]|uniref:5,6-dimethylbenzimidazole synthase n=1 Tax=Corallincola platygyrae TaxID=1193278 RepID=A0ABW4XHE9_9GAMM